MFHMKDWDKTKPMFRLIGGTTLSESAYNLWIRRKGNALEVNEMGAMPEGEELQVVGESSWRGCGGCACSEFLVAQTGAPLESICGQILVSCLINEVVERLLRGVSGQVRVRGGAQCTKKSFGLRSTVLDDLAQKLEQTGLAALENAFATIVTPLNKHGKPPIKHESTEALSDIAAEIEVYIEHNRKKEASSLFL